MGNSVQLFQQSKKLNNFSRSNPNNNSYDTNSNSGSFNYGSGEESGGREVERFTHHENAKNVRSREEIEEAYEDIEDSEMANAIKPFGGFMKASDFAGTKQSIETNKSNS